MKEAPKFDVRFYVKKWLKILSAIEEKPNCVDGSLRVEAV
jgi:hypothetical protein